MPLTRFRNIQVIALCKREYVLGSTVTVEFSSNAFVQVRTSKLSLIMSKPFSCGRPEGSFLTMSGLVIAIPQQIGGSCWRLKVAQEARVVRVPLSHADALSHDGEISRTSNLGVMKDQ